MMLVAGGIKKKREKPVILLPKATSYRLHFIHQQDETPLVFGIDAITELIGYPSSEDSDFAALLTKSFHSISLLSEPPQDDIALRLHQCSKCNKKPDVTGIGRNFHSAVPTTECEHLLPERRPLETFCRCKDSPLAKDIKI